MSEAPSGSHLVGSNPGGSTLGGSNPSKSHSAGEAYAPLSHNKRYVIHVEADGTVSGKHASKWSSRCGALIRSTIPISYTDWRMVHESYLDDLWNSLMKEFELNIDPHIARPLLSKKFSQFFRTEKHTFRKKVLQPLSDKRDALAACPEDIDRVWWEGFVECEWDERRKKICKKNALNKAKSTITHALGRRSYSQIYKTLGKENPGSKIKRSEAWKRSVTRKDGHVLPSAAETFEKIVSVEEKRRALKASGEYTTHMVDDIEHDELAEVFGPEKKNRCRAMSSCSSVKQVKMGQAAKAIAAEKGGHSFEDWKDVMEASIKATVESSMKQFVQELLSGMPQFAKAPPDSASPRTEGASSSVSCQVRPLNLNPEFNALIPQHQLRNKKDISSHGGTQHVILLSRERKEVATGYSAMHTICHGRPVMEDERIVWVTAVLDPDAPIYEAPQDGHSLLGELADGGFLIWLNHRLKYIQ